MDGTRRRLSEISNVKSHWHGLLISVLRPSPDFAARHYDEHRFNCLVMTLVTALAGTSLWTWDFTHDPAGAAHTVWLRLATLPVALPYMAALWLRLDRRLALVAALFMFLGWEACFFVIMGRIEGGFVYGLAGFMYFVFMPLLATRCFTFAGNAALVVAIVAFPEVVAMTGAVPLFAADKYAALLVPAGNMSIIAAFIMAWLYGANDAFRQKLELEAATDALTGLSNRRRFRQKLEEVARRQGVVGLLTLDLDHFKQVNDTIGHFGGDELLIQVARRLQACVRAEDEVARLGGDEFAVILGGEINEREARLVAERMLEALERPFSISGQNLTISASIGVSIRPTHDGTVTQIYEIADAAMYAVKAKGRRGYGFEAVKTAV
ncbi:GGDEF domain-containing protein [Rhizobium sp. CIAT894]|nr:GGDEF domain-containing protein [Rhizobium sp. CIAT894]